jgi:hypothetical protein
VLLGTEAFELAGLSFRPCKVEVVQRVLIALDLEDFKGVADAGFSSGGLASPPLVREYHFLKPRLYHRVEIASLVYKDVFSCPTITSV